MKHPFKRPAKLTQNTPDQDDERLVELEDQQSDVLDSAGHADEDEDLFWMFE